MKLMMALIRQKEDFEPDDEVRHKAELFVESMERIARFHLKNKKVIEQARKKIGQRGFEHDLSGVSSM